MQDILIFPFGTTAACQYASERLGKSGIPTIDHPAPEITHLLLDVPSFDKDGLLRGGGNVRQILERLPSNITVAGGNLSHPALQGYQTVDFLQDETYLAMNAAITADCALRVALPMMTTTFSDTPALIIGWGRIGKCLGTRLHALGCDATIAARKETDRAMLRALGFSAVDIGGIPARLSEFRLLFNTVPKLLLHKDDFSLSKKCIKIDLAASPGMEGDDVIWARGLPGIHAPESSGKLIAETFLRLCKEVS